MSHGKCTIGFNCCRVTISSKYTPKIDDHAFHIVIWIFNNSAKSPIIAWSFLSSKIRDDRR